MITSLGLWMLSARGVKSAVKGDEAPAKEEAAVTETKKEETGEKAKAPEEKKENEQKSTETEKKK